MATYSDTRNTFLQELGINPETAFPLLDEMDAHAGKAIKDLKINVLNFLNNTKELSKKEASFLAYGTALNQKHELLTNVFKAIAIKNEATEAELAEVVACVSLMNVNNVFYRFRHFVPKEAYQAPAGIKMSIMMNPVLGKEFFELLSLAISALNGCELCIKAHEESVLGHGGREARIYEAVRATAVIKGFTAVL